MLTHSQANHSSEFPTGMLSRDVLKSFFSITGNSGNFQYTFGHERIPDNWYRRTLSNPYDIPQADSDVAIQYAAYPESLRLGGNTAGVNTYMGVDLGNLTGGVLTAENLFNPNNPKGACFYAQLVQSLIPDSGSVLVKSLTGITNLLNDHILSVIGGMDCPTVDKFDQSLFNDFPGYKYSPTGMAQTY